MGEDERVGEMANERDEGCDGERVRRWWNKKMVSGMASGMASEMRRWSNQMGNEMANEMANQMANQMANETKSRRMIRWRAEVDRRKKSGQE